LPCHRRIRPVTCECAKLSRLETDDPSRSMRGRAGSAHRRRTAVPLCRCVLARLLLVAHPLRRPGDES
jgi:hypothetical protein